MIHVAQISFYLDPKRRQPAKLLLAWPTLVDVAEAASLGGARVSVIQACHSNETITENGVVYHFLTADAGAWTWSNNVRLRALLHRLQPDVLHVHGLDVGPELASLSRLAGGIPILVQDHANRPPRFWRRRTWRRDFASADAVAFCAPEQAIPFEQAQLFDPSLKIYAIPESSSRFEPGDQRAARQATGLHGNPCVLWVGHLDANKDPLSVLDGISLAAATLPKMELWCYYGSAPLLSAVKQRVDRDPALAGRVHLQGRAAHSIIENAMRAADVFVLGSHREGSGYSLLEAMACGLPPVVADIPSFRTLTGHGRVGKLWPHGNPSQLAQALIAISQTQASQRAVVRGHFERELSFRALGQKLLAAYQDMLRRRVPVRAAVS
jgi:glycosyltransferase involved in cell wall biosynthesis